MPFHCMVDLETWSNAPNATIISIGAVKFHPGLYGVEDRFHVAIDPELTAPSIAERMDISAGTMKWWLHKDRADARDHWNAMEKVDLATALVGFAEWFGAHSLPLWGNGATFDNVILRHAYKATGLDCPWKFWDDRCYRTVKNMRLDFGIERIMMPAGGGVAHSALYDAERQTLHLQVLLDLMGIMPSDAPPPMAQAAGQQHGELSVEHHAKLDAAGGVWGDPAQLSDG